MSASLELGNGNWAVKSDALLGYKTINGKYYPREFTVTRATTATRVNPQGLVEVTPYNLLSWSEEFDNASWNKVNATITANTTTAPNGTLTADTIEMIVGSTTQKVITQFFKWPAGYVGTASIYVKASTGSKVFIANGSTGVGIFFDLSSATIEGTIGSFTGTITSVGDGWYRITATHTASASQTLSFGIYETFTGNWATSTAFTATTESPIFIWGAQLVEGTEPLDYLPTTDRLDVARIDYSLGSANLLLEPQRTNLALQSSNFDSGSWTKLGATTPIVTANTAISPSGVMDADRLQFVSVATSAIVYQSLSHTSGQQITVSVYAKRNAATDQVFRLFGDGGVSISSIFTATSEWQRFTYTYTATVTGGRTMGIYSVPNIASDIQIWGYQFEVGAYATSYIPTTTSSVTRNLDSITRNNIYTNGLITDAGGTWFVELRNNLAYTRDTFGLGISLGDNSNTTYFSIRNRNTTGTNLLRIDKFIGGAFTELFLTTSVIVKIAIKWNGTTADVFVNGVKVVSATAFSATALEALVCNAADVPKYINEMALYPTPLSDGELISLTTL